MTCVHDTSDRTQAQLLRSALEAEGIPAVVQGEHLSALQGEAPVGTAARYRVFILDDEQLPRARSFVAQWLAPPPGTAGGPWVCRRCGERHEPHFGSCWRCGADAEGG